MKPVWVLASLVLGACHAPVASAPAPKPSVPKSPPALPDPVLTSHDGRQLRFHDELVRDRCVVIQFLYLNCENICPPTTRRLQELQALLEPEEQRRWRFLSISLDPGNDTPESLAAFAARWQAPPGWLYLRGEPAAIADLRRALGERLALASETEDPLTHSASVIVGNDARGDWRVLPSTLSAERMLATLRRLAR
jgi:protein SCO1/2